MDRLQRHSSLCQRCGDRVYLFRSLESLLHVAPLQVEAGRELQHHRLALLVVEGSEDLNGGLRGAGSLRGVVPGHVRGDQGTQRLALAEGVADRPESRQALLRLPDRNACLFFPPSLADVLDRQMGVHDRREGGWLLLRADLPAVSQHLFGSLQALPGVLRGQPLRDAYPLKGLLSPQLQFLKQPHRFFGCTQPASRLISHGAAKCSAPDAA
mmetsp:Transcript_43868/g.140604  ORF Transcript_43868/g.140604 Transcript_43868/m.140604 type:complete len:212 (+) Transcript_43868:1345-1980(+)